MVAAAAVPEEPLLVPKRQRSPSAAADVAHSSACPSEVYEADWKSSYLVLLFSNVEVCSWVVMRSLSLKEA